MRNLVMKSMLFAGAVILMSVTAHAQAIKATIPFGFEANGKSMPAGEYTVMPTSSLDGMLYVMRSLDMPHEGVLLAGRYTIANSTREAKLVFDRRGDGFYLTEVWDGAMAREVQCPRGRSSILAMTKPAARVVIAAHR